MASIKISELNETTSMSNGDLLPVVDTTADETKKITYENLKREIIDFYTISGTATTNTTLSAFNYVAEETLQYPTGYNSTNCIPVAFAILGKNGQAYNYTFGGYSGDGEHAELLQLLMHDINRTVRFYEDNIKIDIYYPVYTPSSTGAQTITYKLILMKIS